MVFGFHSTHEALDAEALLENGGIEVVPIPSPAAVSANCGIALRVSITQSQKAKRFLLEGGLAPQSQVRIDDF